MSGLDSLFIATRILLSLIFALAAAGKLRAPAEVRKAAHELGVPALFLRMAPQLLLLAEGAVAVALLVPATAWCAAMTALALLAAYSALLLANLARGRTPPCACFAWMSRPDSKVGPGVLMRNGTIAGLIVAVLATAGDPPNAAAASALLVIGLALAAAAAWIGLRPLA